MTPDPMRATAERLAREVYRNLQIGLMGTGFDGLYPWLRKASIECVLAGMAHRDRTAEREAVEKFVAAYCADDELNLQRFLTHYLAAEFDAGERVTVIPCATCGMDLSGLDVVQYDSGPTPQHSDPRHCIAALSDAVKRMAEQRGAER